MVAGRGSTSSVVVGEFDRGPVIAGGMAEETFTPFIGWGSSARFRRSVVKRASGVALDAEVIELPGAAFIATRTGSSKE